MFDFLRKVIGLSESKQGMAKKKSMGDEIRKYAKTKYIIPARNKKEARVSFTAAELDKGMGLSGKHAMICSAIDAKKFLDFARVALIRREGPGQGAAAKWTFKVK